MYKDIKTELIRLHDLYNIFEQTNLINKIEAEKKDTYKIGHKIEVFGA